MRRIFAPLVLLASLCACRAQEPRRAATGSGLTAASLAGCYALYGTNGQLLSGREYYGSSPLVRLDQLTIGRSTDSINGRRFRRARRLDQAGALVDTVNASMGIGPSWTVGTDDTLRISFSNGFSGAYLSLGLGNATTDTLHGYIEVHWDFSGPTDHGKAWAVRVPSCHDPNGAS